MRRLNWTDTPVEWARSGGHGSASASRVVTVRTLIVAAVVLMLLLPLGKVEAREARTVPSEFIHVVATVGCTVRSEVTATSGNHSGEQVKWKFWTTNGGNEQIVWEDEQFFTARNNQMLFSTATYATDNYHVDVSVWKTRRDGTKVHVWNDTASGSLQCP